MCETEKCPGLWLHYECVEVDPEDIPEGSWHCPGCRTSSVKHKTKPLHGTKRVEKSVGISKNSTVELLLNDT